MKIHFFGYTAIFLILFLLISSFFIPITISQKENLNYLQYSDLNDGQILYSPLWTTTTYLLDRNGEMNHTWLSNYFPGVAVRWLGNGKILRTIRAGLGPPTGGVGGGVQKVKWDGTVLWNFIYNGNDYCSHHDVKGLPNGNVLLIAWETKTRAEAIAAGRNPDHVSNFQGFMPDYIVEVQPTGPTSGVVVWEWHVWDHLIQDYDISKANYGIVSDHPELIDINYQISSYDDWMHTNSIDYNEEFDQILLSVCYFNEIWVIDHSTTTEEAAGHTGGNSGMGGDLLYRWGNPQSYGAGTAGDQKLFHQHDARWIDEGCPGEGNILIFNNGNNRPGGSYTSVDEIIPPIDEDGKYYFQYGDIYGPDTQTWIYTAIPPTNFFVGHLGGAQRLPSGNTLITNGETGEIFEVTPDKVTVWQYDVGGQLFRAVFIPVTETKESDLHCEGNLNWVNVNSGVTLYANLLVKNIGKNDSILNWKVTSFPDWGSWSIRPDSGEGLKPEDEEIIVQVSVISPNETNKKFSGYIRIENQENPEDFDVIPVYLKTLKQKTIFQPFFNFLESHLNLLQIIHKLTQNYRK